MPTLTWVGKDKVVNHHHDVPFRVLNKQYSFTADNNLPNNSTQNRIIHGDNLEALKSLLPEFEGKVKCIYIDPPYNTGNEGWVYNDNVNDPKIKKWLGQVVGKEGEDLSRHDKWLCMMYPRLKLLHKLLADDGVIFVSIGDEEQAHLKLVCDEIFGYSNCLADVIWQHSIQPKGYAGTFSVHHNHTLIFAKSLFVLSNLERTEEDNKSYTNQDERGRYRLGDVRNALYRPNLIYTVKTPSGKIIEPPANGWRYSKETMEQKIAVGEIVFSEDESRLIRKIYLDSVSGRTPETIWFGKDVGTTRDASSELKAIFTEAPFDTPKPTRLIERILQISTDKNSIILDSFAGSGTTAHAVLKLNAQDGGNRQFILIEMMDYAENITAERVRRVINGYGQDNKKVAGLGGGFDYYTIGQPLFLDNDNLNEAVGINTIRDYITYSEGIPTHEQTTPDNPYNPYVLGLNREVAWVFFYEQERTTTLDIDFLGTLQFGQQKPNSLIVYADKCLLNQEFMRKYNIRFKKIPRDITRF
ncbi:MAG: site-specific DNA-methyltransferase [Moraxellaceae bacterium]|nr:site-specific DNA-methyltransferase [Moraxellaceae bacterium]